MASPASPAETRAFILERLVGDRGETKHVVEAARQLGTRALPVFSENLNALLSSPVTIELGAIDVMRLGDVRPDAGNQAMTIASSPASSDTLVMLVGADAVAVMVCAMFGGDPEMPAAPIERELSPTEVDVATMICHELATAMNGRGGRALNIRFPVPDALAGARLKGKVLRDGPAVRLEFLVTCGPSAGAIHLLMPQRVLMQRTGSDGDAAEAPAGADWGARFSEEVMRSTVDLRATMTLASMTLGELAALEAGQVIEIAPAAQSQARLSARQKTLFVCEFGKLGQNYTVRVRHPYDAGQEFIDRLLPA